MALTTSTYKKAHKPVMNENSHYYQGYFYPKNPEKCLSKDNIYRSSWEAKWMQYCDQNSTIVRWASEPVAVKYRNPVANLKYCKQNGLDPKDPTNWKVCNYYTDFWCEMKKPSGEVEKIFIEIKPWSQTQQPKPVKADCKLKEAKAYNKAAETWLVNTAKWKAAKAYFEAKGCKFMIVTEKTLKKLGLL